MGPKHSSAYLGSSTSPKKLCFPTYNFVERGIRNFQKDNEAYPDFMTYEDLKS